MQAQSRQPHFPSVSCGAAFQPPRSCSRSSSAQYGRSASAPSHGPSLCMLSHSLVPRVPQDTVPSAQKLTVSVCSPAATLRGSRARELISSSLSLCSNLSYGPCSPGNQEGLPHVQMGAPYVRARHLMDPFTLSHRPEATSTEPPCHLPGSQAQTLTSPAQGSRCPMVPCVRASCW